MSFLLTLLSGIRFFIGHIRDKNYFPKPLGKAEEKEYLSRWFSGDEKAKEKLVEHNMRLVAHIAQKYVSSSHDSDDLISIGSIGLIKAVNSYKPDKATHLATYASKCIENEILMYLRATKKLKNEVSLSEPIGTDKEGNEVTLIDILASGEIEVSENAELKIHIKHMLRKMNEILDEREKRILIMRYGLGGHRALAQREVAERLGISRSYVSRIEKAALDKLRGAM